ncbi:MAG: Crp/Fnr family transcriptional regulator [Granulosicoccus sp.]
MVYSTALCLPDPLNRLDPSALRRQSYSAGDILFHQGENTHGVFYLLDGSITLQRVTESGHEVIILQAGTGETFAEASLFHDIYHCTAKVTTACTVIECSKKAVLARYKDDPDFALAMSARFANQVQQTRARLELFSIKKAEERVFQALANGMLKESVKTLACEIGLSQEAVYRSLSSLTKTGRIEKTGYGRYTV